MASSTPLTIFEMLFTLGELTLNDYYCSPSLFVAVNVGINFNLIKQQWLLGVHFRVLAFNPLLSSSIHLLTTLVCAKSLEQKWQQQRYSHPLKCQP